MIALILSILFFNTGGEKTSNLDYYLSKNLSEFKKYEYEVVSLPSYVKSIDDERISFNTDREFRLNYGYAYIPVDIAVSKDNVTQSVVSLKVNLFDEVLVAVKKIKRGAVVSAADFIIKEEDITHLRSGAVKDYKTVNNHKAVMNIGEGAILQENMIEHVPDMVIGQKVSAFSTLGTVTVSFQVSLREEGRIGETVRVVREDGLTFKAQIVNSQKVKIIE